MYHFCTYFDHNYLPQGLLLYESLEQHCPCFRLFALCLSDECYESLKLMGLSNLVPITLKDFEAAHPELREVKQERSEIEYFFTLSPYLPLHVLERFPEVEMITYLDADLCFYSDPVGVFEEIGGAAVAIVSHRFPERLRHMEVYGIYNVAWVSFRRCAESLRILEWWRNRCLEWCHDRAEGGKYADQKYLDDWPERFSSVHVIEHKGVNLAPWNLECFELSTSEGRVHVDGEPLVFYHYHSLRRVMGRIYSSGFHRYKSTLTPFARDTIYRPYLTELRRIEESLDQLLRVKRRSVRGRISGSEPSGLLARSLELLRNMLLLRRIFATKSYILYRDDWT